MENRKFIDPAFVPVSEREDALGPQLMPLAPGAQEPEIDPVNPSIWDAVKDAAGASKHHIVEVQAMEYIAGHVGSDESVMLSPAEAKEKFGIEVDEPISSTRAYYEGELKKEAILDNERLGRHFSWDTPVNAAVAFTVMGGIASLTPVAIASGAAVGAAVGSVAPGIGTVLGGIVGAGAVASKRLFSAFKQTRVATNIARSARLTQAIAGTERVIRPAVYQAAKVGAKLRKAMASQAVKRGAAIGAGNVLEMKAIQTIDAQMGYKYELGPGGIAAGFFAPAIMTGGAAAILGRGRPKSVEKSYLGDIDGDAPSLAKLTKEVELDRTPQAIKEQQMFEIMREGKGAIKRFDFRQDGTVKFYDKDNKVISQFKGKGTVAEATIEAADYMKNYNQRLFANKTDIDTSIKLSETKDMSLPKNQAETYIKQAKTTHIMEQILNNEIGAIGPKTKGVDVEVLKAVKNEFAAINFAKKILGDDVVDEFLTMTAAGLLQTKTKVKLGGLFPQLKSVKDLLDFLSSNGKHLNYRNWKVTSDGDNVFITNAVGDYFLGKTWKDAKKHIDGKTFMMPMWRKSQNRPQYTLGDARKPATVEEILELKEDIINKYMEDNAIDTKPPIKRDMFNEDTPPPAVEKAEKDFIDSAKGDDTDPFRQNMGKAADEVDESIDGYLKCLRGDVSEE